jgi:hypothetical protein
VIASNSNAPVAARPTGPGGPLVVNPLDEFIGFQAGLAEAVLDGLVTQLKLISAVMMSFPLSWLIADAVPQPVAAAPPDFSAASNVTGPEVLPARRKARKAKSEKPAQA